MINGSDPVPNVRGGIAIGVPVRNEAARLGRLLHALAAQREAPPFVLCLFFDNCTDGSADLARQMAGDLPFTMMCDACDDGGLPNAGLARMRAMASAASLAPHGVVLTTDADGAPEPDWLARNLLALDRADVIAGRIVRGANPPAPRQDRLERYYDRLYALRRMLDPVAWDDATHHWTSGSSLAMRSAIYRAVGGFPAIANGEDAAFCDAAVRAGYRVRRDVTVRVRTSARRLGRADDGFATALAGLDRLDRGPFVCHPGDEAWRFRMQASARFTHGSGNYGHLADRLDLPLREVEQVAGECRNGEAFAARIVGAPPGGARSVSLCQAELLLAGLEQPDVAGAA